jgi:hypothetical protein
VPGPVTDWGDKFNIAENIFWEAPGELRLGYDDPVMEKIGGFTFDTDSLFAVDLDDDDDTDIIAVTAVGHEIAWWENEDGIGTDWEKRDIDDQFNSGVSVYAIDMNSDDVIDVVGAAYYDYNIAWWENVNGAGTDWDLHIVEWDFTGACSVFPADIDGDYDIDLLACSWIIDEVSWWENLDGYGNTWDKHLIEDDYGWADSVYAADIDGDIDTDVISVASSDQDISWWENLNGTGGSWEKHVIDDSPEYPRCVNSADVDGDTDYDVIAAWDVGVNWWENLTGGGTSWNRHSVDEDFETANFLYPKDIDGDNDIDLVGTAGWWSQEDLTWWENVDSAGTVWCEHVLDDDKEQRPNTGYAADVDNDGYTDLIGVWDYWDLKIAWWDIIRFVDAGWLVSSVYDTQGYQVWDEIDWLADKPGGTSLRFKVRSSSNPDDMGDWSEFIDSPSSLGQYLDGGDRYVQYKPFLGTGHIRKTPKLKELSISWDTTDADMESFAADSIRVGIKISWKCSLEGIAGFNIYRSSVKDKTESLMRKLNREMITGTSPFVYLDDTVIDDVTYNYWLEVVNQTGLGITLGPVSCTWSYGAPEVYMLYQSRPNPARGSATIAFDLAEAAVVRLEVYDLTGRKVSTLVDTKLPAGEYKLEVADFEPGVYVYKLEAGTYSAVRKMIIIE